jgi:hypothetical protein
MHGKQCAGGEQTPGTSERPSRSVKRKLYTADNTSKKKARKSSGYGCSKDANVPLPPLRAENVITRVRHVVIVLCGKLSEGIKHCSRNMQYQNMPNTLMTKHCNFPGFYPVMEKSSVSRLKVVCAAHAFWIVNEMLGLRGKYLGG